MMSESPDHEPIRLTVNPAPSAPELAAVVAVLSDYLNRVADSDMDESRVSPPSRWELVARRENVNDARSGIWQASWGQDVYR